MSINCIVAYFIRLAKSYRDLNWRARELTVITTG